MDKHYLRPLFAPASVLVYSGGADAAAAETAAARVLHENLRAQRYAGTLQFVDLHTRGTLAQLALARADLAVIAVAPHDGAAALEAACRVGCRAALVLSGGGTAEQAAELHRIARREGIQLLGPNGLGLQCPRLQLNAGTAGPLARPGALALVSQSGALTASMLDWAHKNAVGFSNVVSLGP